MFAHWAWFVKVSWSPASTEKWPDERRDSARPGQACPRSGLWLCQLSLSACLSRKPGIEEVLQATVSFSLARPWGGGGREGKRSTGCRPPVDLLPCSTSRLATVASSAELLAACDGDSVHGPGEWLKSERALPHSPIVPSKQGRACECQVGPPLLPRRPSAAPRAFANRPAYINPSSSPSSSSSFLLFFFILLQSVARASPLGRGEGLHPFHRSKPRWNRKRCSTGFGC